MLFFLKKRFFYYTCSVDSFLCSDVFCIGSPHNTEHRSHVFSPQWNSIQGQRKWTPPKISEHTRMHVWVGVLNGGGKNVKFEPKILINFSYSINDSMKECSHVVSHLQLSIIIIAHCLCIWEEACSSPVTCAYCFHIYYNHVFHHFQRFWVRPYTIRIRIYLYKWEFVGSCAVDIFLSFRSTCKHTFCCAMMTFIACF